MSARRNPIEVDARRYAARDLRGTRKYRRDMTALQILGETADSLARYAAELLVAGDIPTARRYARAHQLVTESRGRLSARHTRAYDAEKAGEAAEHGIKAGEVVRVTRVGVGTQVPVDTVATIEDVRGVILYTTIDGARRIMWAKDVERVEPDPIPESRIEEPAQPNGDERPFQVDEAVLTLSRGVGTVEHVDIVSGVTVRVAGGETWRYDPEQLTRASAVVPDGADDGTCRAAVSR